METVQQQYCLRPYWAGKLEKVGEEPEQMGLVQAGAALVLGELSQQIPDQLRVACKQGMEWEWQSVRAQCMYACKYEYCLSKKY